MTDKLTKEENPLTIELKIEYLNGLAVKYGKATFLISEKEENKIVESYNNYDELKRKAQQLDFALPWLRENLTDKQKEILNVVMDKESRILLAYLASDK